MRFADDYQLRLSVLAALASWLFGFDGFGTQIAMAQPPVSGDSEIRAEVADSEIVIRTTNRLAGAIHSLTWNGKEFINSTDHGRQLQSAANFDLRTEFSGETFNPTEAGSRLDGAGSKSTSLLLHLVAKKNLLQTTNRMAFWLAPGQRSSGILAKNSKRLSNHTLTKRVVIGYKNLPHVIQYDVTFGMPIDERHNYAQFEAVTGYMPAEFSEFWIYNSVTKKLEPISDGPGEQKHPVILSTPSGSHAMGVFSPEQPSRGYEAAGYGRFRFSKQKVVKWNCVFRIRNRNGVKPGDYSFRNFVIVGNLEMVTKGMNSLHSEFAKKT
jgi:hypothetical protein